MQEMFLRPATGFVLGANVRRQMTRIRVSAKYQMRRFSVGEIRSFFLSFLVRQLIYHCGFACKLNAIMVLDRLVEASCKILHGLRLFSAYLVECNVHLPMGL